MKRRFLTLSSLLLLITAPLWAEAETYKLDPVHSSVHFRVSHNSVSTFQGGFNAVDGQIVFDEANPSNTSFEITVDANSVDTRNERRDGHVKSPDFLNAAQFPNLTFKSQSVRKTGEDAYEVSGKITIRGVTKDITAVVRQIGARDLGRGGFRRGFSTELKINRRDFNVSYGNPEGLGDEVTLIIDVEAVRQ